MTPLHYHAGPPVRLGDRVRWGDEGQGTIVVMIAEQTALPGYVAAEWDYLVHGCMISVDAVGLFHYDAEGLLHDANLVLLARA
ncbi:hypothetical protein SAMN04487939_11477 [Lysobacter sp. yr284]|uniref:hypothetical protein n=1 Tax=Lysobacter sp. yr284 TaxID=1761791 RepID=UPI00089AADC6|nr:hypothetical protein [Lysobacter sp. yr284]SDZ07015.1 hypothetical protein SAMN04487939_11477 [Lysobacter sp. yr284]